VSNEALESIAQRRGVDVSSLVLADISRDDVVAAMAAYQSRPDGRSGQGVKRSASALHRFFTCLHSFFSWCVLTERLDKSPATTIKAPKAGVRVPKAMSAEECEALVAAAGSGRFPERDLLAVLLAMTAGLRLGEMSSLGCSSFLFEQGEATHVRVVGKGNKERVVPLNDRLRSALAAYLPVRQARLDAVGATSDALFLSQRGAGMAMSRDGLGQLFDALVKRAGLKVPGRRVHACRHSFATHVLAAGADILSVSELLGHTSVATTQIYLRVDPSRLASAVEASALARG
jgi:integrase/recombinase XerD